MKVVLISMPDVVPIVIHEMAIHMPNHGIACVGGNVDAGHDVFLIDLVRKRGNIARYLKKTLKKIHPDLVGLSAMTWQYTTALAIIGLIRKILPDVKIVLGGYHTTLMSREMADSGEAHAVDFMIRGEGEETFRRLVNALDVKNHHDEKEDLASIPGLSFKSDGQWLHNETAPLCDLSHLKLPIRDGRRLTWGYHFMYSRIEVMETSRGCTRNCNFCSIRHMYGRSYRTYPIERILADLDDIYYRKKTRLVFVADDNMVLNPKWVTEVCDAIISRGYRNLRLVVQADCISMAKNEAMVAKMAQAGFQAVFLGIENASRRNLQAMEKGDLVDAARQAVGHCHRHGIMVMGGLIFGLPDDDERSIEQNYLFLKDLGVDGAYCQMISPFPKTVMRDQLLEAGLITNYDGYYRYNGLWANVKTKKLSAEKLQYAFWYYRQTALGWWTPSEFAKSQGRLWTAAWTHLVMPVMKFFIDRKIRREGWEGRYRRDMARLEAMNRFDDLVPNSVPQSMTSLKGLGEPPHDRP